MIKSFLLKKILDLKFKDINLYKIHLIKKNSNYKKNFKEINIKHNFFKIKNEYMKIILYKIKIFHSASILRNILLINLASKDTVFYSL